MGYLVKMPLENGESVVLETDDGPDGPVTRSGRVPEALAEVGQTVESYLGGIRSVTAAMVSKLRDIDDGVESVDIALGVRLSARAGLIIANTAGEANFNITVRWARHHPEAPRTISLAEGAPEPQEQST